MARIMLVDDDAVMLTLLRETLEFDRQEILGYTNPLRAWAALQDSELPLPDLIILDAMMPELDGYSFHHKLLEDSRTRLIPVIIATAKGKLQQSFETSPNVVAFLEKPFDINVLREKVAAALK